MRDAGDPSMMGVWPLESGGGGKWRVRDGRNEEDVRVSEREGNKVDISISVG